MRFRDWLKRGESLRFTIPCIVVILGSLLLLAAHAATAAPDAQPALRMPILPRHGGSENSTSAAVYCNRRPIVFMTALKLGSTIIRILGSSCTWFWLNRREQ